MAITTYSELKTAIGSWINRADSADYADDCIDLFEAWVNRNLRVRQMQQEATATVAERLELPSDFLEMRDIQYQGQSRRQLQYVSPEYADLYDGTGTSGDPTYYTIVNNEIRIIPAPSGSSTVLMSYYKKLTALDGTNTSNWLLALYPDAYLFGALFYARMYITDDQRAAFVKEMHNETMAEVRRAGKRSEYGGALQVRMG